jgi:hypothetical protein
MCVKRYLVSKLAPALATIDSAKDPMVALTAHVFRLIIIIRIIGVRITIRVRRVIRVVRVM